MYLWQFSHLPRLLFTPFFITKTWKLLMKGFTSDFSPSFNWISRFLHVFLNFTYFSPFFLILISRTLLQTSNSESSSSSYSLLLLSITPLVPCFQQLFFERNCNNVSSYWKLELSLSTQARVSYSFISTQTLVLFVILISRTPLEIATTYPATRSWQKPSFGSSSHSLLFPSILLSFPVFNCNFSNTVTKK